jgi:hypothetical protein
MTDTALPPAATTDATRTFPAALTYRVLAGLGILLAWEAVVRAYAPPYVAKPSTVIAAIPRVIVDPKFLEATSIPLAASLRQRVLRGADGGGAAAAVALVRL